MKIGEDFSGLVIRTYTREVINIYNVIKVVSIGFLLNEIKKRAKITLILPLSFSSKLNIKPYIFTSQYYSNIHCYSGTNSGASKRHRA